MTAHAVHIDELLDANLLQNPLGVTVIQRRVSVRGPARRFVRNAECREHLVIKVVLARETLRDVLQEQTGLGSLNDSMVVGRSERHHFATPSSASARGSAASKPAGHPSAPTPK